MKWIHSLFWGLISMICLMSATNNTIPSEKTSPFSYLESCVKDNRFMKSKATVTFSNCLPSFDAEAHHKTVLDKTKNYRGFETHEFSGQIKHLIV